MNGGVQVLTTWTDAGPLDFVGVLKKMAEVMIEYFKEFNLPREYWMGVYSRLRARGGERFF
ncbi:hypothetical protein APY94_00050 [Thermococcus celericrescens]|uniref:Uncharacterized protein n=2 Tax=Thermococcus celericrescens TaxID=227598 RepID=A0A117IU79_9EURY|nr:hypothetical protein APY94_00050 [Thermococcus celericrescens]